MWNTFHKVNFYATMMVVKADYLRLDGRVTEKINLNRNFTFKKFNVDFINFVYCHLEFYLIWFTCYTF